MAESMIIETLSRYHQRSIDYEAVSFNHLSEADQRNAYALWINSIIVDFLNYAQASNISHPPYRF